MSFLRRGVRSTDNRIHPAIILPVVAVFLGLFLSTCVVAATTIAPGQSISITVPSHPEFSTRAVVEPDGTIEYPLLAGVPVVGMTASEVRSLLLPLLMKYETEPSVFVIISQTQLVRIQIYGAVASPGKYEGVSPLNLQQVIAMAGGLTDEANISRLLIFSQIEGKKVERTYDLASMYHADSLAITPDLNDGDVVIVPRLNAATAVRVLGIVEYPGEVYVSPGDNLYDAIIRAGGFAQNADTKRVRIITDPNRISPEAEFDVYGFLKSGKISDLPIITAGDIVIVPERKGWHDFSWWVVWIRDIAILTSSLVILNNSI